MKRGFLSAVTAAALAVVITLALSVAGIASERDQRFFESVEGHWAGPGEVVAGKYKGTKFTCNLTGKTPEHRAGMTLDGICRVGLFTQKMSATVEEVGHSGYHGTFLDGARGKGLDIVAGNVSGRTVVFALNRNALKGTMAAKLPDPNTMMVTISVRVENDLVPVIGVNLKRTDSVAIGAVAQD
ncbi:MAG: hypothetical protein BGN87_17545 [Rhizobiales bacterium 65-79]|jgi:hypothetical protein|nr:hypothetical protein [Hyphomicrobiales bacterium]OJU06760.1 MAG: hypothetical protein BGN87_17545 [Rhizobiales bacterium 65-79]